MLLSRGRVQTIASRHYKKQYYFCKAVTAIYPIYQIRYISPLRKAAFCISVGRERCGRRLCAESAGILFLSLMDASSMEIVPARPALCEMYNA